MTGILALVTIFVVALLVVGLAVLALWWANESGFNT
jgi:nitrogen fixation-related uncharacterized protein